MKLYDARAELLAIKTFTSSRSLSKAAMLGLDKTMFATENARAAFDRINVVMSRRGKLMTWSDLCNDTALPSSARSALKDYKKPPLQTEAGSKKLITRLSSLRRLRTLNQLSREISEALQGDAVDDQELLDKAASRLAAASSGAAEAKVVHIGRGDTGKAAVEDLLTNKTTVRFIPTGFKSFDNKALGWPVGGLVMIAAPPGDGKSMTVQTLAHNMAAAGHDTLLCPLEMDSTSIMQRALSNATGLPMSKMLEPRISLTLQEKRLVRRRYQEMSAKIRKAGARLTIMSDHSESVSLGAILNYAVAAKFRTVVIDYIGLLSGADGDDQAKALGRMARTAKLWAEANKTVVIMAAQLTDDGLVKYSRAIHDHADNLWTFSRSAEDHASRTMLVHQRKSRRNEKFSFTLHADSSTMTVRDMTAEEAKKATETRGGSKGYANASGGKKRPKFNAKYSRDLA